MMYTVSDFICVQHHWDIGLLRHRWNGVEHFAGLHLFQSVHESLLDMARSEQASSWLMELSNAPLPVSDQQWLEERWMPEVIHINVQQLAVVAADAYNLMVLENLMVGQSTAIHNRAQIFADAHTALEWLTHSPELACQLEDEWRCGVPEELKRS